MASTSAPSSARGSLVPKILLALASAAVGVLLVEALVRGAGLDRPLVWQPHPDVGWWHVPGSTMHWTQEGDGLVQINSQGLRDVERPIAKPNGVFRIAVFGDSMTEGVQVNLQDTYTQQLESRLRGRGIRAEVLNFGVNGYSPLQGYLLYRHAGRAYQPDLVLHALFLDNDVADSHLELAFGQIGGPVVAPGEPFSVDLSRAEASRADYEREPLHTIRRWSAIYRMLSIARWQRLEANRVTDAASATGGIPRRYLVYADPVPGKWNDAWRTVERVETAFAQEAQANGSRFALLSVPAGQVVSDEAWAAVVAENGSMSAERWNVFGPENRLRGFAESSGLALLSPLQSFRAASSRETLFFGGMGHLTPEGHRVMADFLESALIEHGLVPTAAHDK